MARYIDANAIEKVLEEKHFNRVLDSDRWLIADIKKSIMDLPTIDAVPHWIPCSERLPQALEEVIVTSKYGHVYTSRIVHGEFEYGGEVLAWMPLPKPYEVKE